MSALEDWAQLVCADLGVDPAVADVRMILDLARDSAHAVARPAAPLTTFLLGVAVGRGAPAAETAARISALAGRWPAAAETKGPDLDGGPTPV